MSENFEYMYLFNSDDIDDRDNNVNTNSYNCNRTDEVTTHPKTRQNKRT